MPSRNWTVFVAEYLARLFVAPTGLLSPAAAAKRGITCGQATNSVTIDSRNVTRRLAWEV